MTKSELVHKWFDNLWHQGIESTIDDLLASDAVAHGLAAGDLVVVGGAQILLSEEFRAQMQVGEGEDAS